VECCFIGNTSFLVFNKNLMTQMAMTQNFVWITTDDTESDYLEYRQWKEEKIIKAEEQERFDYTLLKGYH
jgi:hypothetical protein